MAALLEHCQRCGSTELSDHWELTPCELFPENPEPLVNRRFVQTCRRCGKQQRDRDATITPLRLVPPNSRPKLTVVTPEAQAELQALRADYFALREQWPLRPVGATASDDRARLSRLQRLVRRFARALRRLADLRL
jgi:hypothetical protein